MEIAVVALILSIIVALAMPNIQMALLKARAVDVASSLEVMRVAVLSYLAENNQWPPCRRKLLLSMKPPTSFGKTRASSA